MNSKINILTKKGFTNLEKKNFSMINVRKAQKQFFFFLMAVAKEAPEIFYEL